jgi:hypothetical protein
LLPLSLLPVYEIGLFSGGCVVAIALIAQLMHIGANGD